MRFYSCLRFENFNPILRFFRIHKILQYLLIVTLVLFSVQTKMSDADDENEKPVSPIDVIYDTVQVIKLFLMQKDVFLVTLGTSSFPSGHELLH